MRLWLQGSLAVNLVICGGLALLTGALGWLWSGKTSVDKLRAEVEAKEALLGSHPPARKQTAGVEEIQAAIEDWRTMNTNEGLRLEALSDTARESGATIAGLQSIERALADDGQTATCSYLLKLRGRYDQLARFCDRIYAARGVTAIESMTIESLDDAASPGALRASMRVAWYAPNAGVKVEPETKLP